MVVSNRYRSPAFSSLKYKIFSFLRPPNYYEQQQSDVETSYEVMIGQLANIGSAASAATSSSGGAAPSSSQRNASTNAAAAANATTTIVIPRSRNLFTIWKVNDGRLTPLSADWTFPGRLGVLEAMNLWLIGDAASHTPPLQYLTAGHLKHVKVASDSLNKLRRFMKVCTGIYICLLGLGESTPCLCCCC